MPKDFISFLDWSTEDLMDLVEAARTYRQMWEKRRFPQVLSGRRIALIWDAEGFRNRVGFELGIAELGGVSVRVPGALDERESIEDLARYLDNWFDAIVARTSTHEHMLRLAESARDSGDKCKNFVQPSMRDPRGSGPHQGNERRPYRTACCIHRRGDESRALMV